MLRGTHRVKEFYVNWPSIAEFSGSYKCRSQILLQGEILIRCLCAQSKAPDPLSDSRHRFWDHRLMPLLGLKWLESKGLRVNSLRPSREPLPRLTQYQRVTFRRPAQLFSAAAQCLAHQPEKAARAAQPTLQQAHSKDSSYYIPDKRSCVQCG